MLDRQNEIFIISKIIEARKEKGLSIKEVANELGLPTTTYQSNEKKYSMTMDRILKVCEIIGIDLRDLLTEILEPNKEQENQEQESVMLTHTTKDLQEVSERLASLESNMSSSLELIAKSLQEIAQKLKDKD